VSAEEQFSQVTGEKSSSNCEECRRKALLLRLSVAGAGHGAQLGLKCFSGRGSRSHCSRPESTLCPRWTNRLERSDGVSVNVLFFYIKDAFYHCGDTNSNKQKRWIRCRAKGL